LAVLPLLSYALLKYSKYVATHILKLGYQVTVLNTQQHKAAATAAAAAAP
jgi:3-hydroxyisobutyrate dehydrogenase-like beta-hydroxyacid dehydrogenase